MIKYLKVTIDRGRAGLYDYYEPIEADDFTGETFLDRDELAEEADGVVLNNVSYWWTVVDNEGD